MARSAAWCRAAAKYLPSGTGSGRCRQNQCFAQQPFEADVRLIDRTEPHAEIQPFCPQLANLRVRRELMHQHAAFAACGTSGGEFRVLQSRENRPRLREEHVPATVRWDVTRTQDPGVHGFFRAGAAGIRTQTAFSQGCRYPQLDLAGAPVRARQRASARTSHNPSGSAVDSLMTVTATDELTERTQGMRDR